MKEYLALQTHQMDYRTWYDSAWNHVRAMQGAGDNSTMLVFCQIFYMIPTKKTLWRWNCSGECRTANIP